jgi:hypothetical protein
MSNVKSYQLDDTTGRELLITNAFENGIFMTLDVLLSLSNDDLLIIQNWLRKWHAGIYGALDLEELLDCMNSDYKNYKTVQEYIAPDILTAIKDNPYAKMVCRILAEHVLSGKNPYPKPEPEKRKSKPTNGYVYLIKADNGLYKIGKSKNLHARINEFGVKLPVKTELIHSIANSDFSTLELELHERFSDKREHGEWFRLSESDIEEIKQINQE